MVQVFPYRDKKKALYKCLLILKFDVFEFGNIWFVTDFYKFFPVVINKFLITFGSDYNLCFE